MSELVNIQDFSKIDLRIGKVLECQAHPNADRLYVLKVDIGGEQRQIVAGIRLHYAPEDLLGKSVAVVCNLEPAMLRGVESQGMLLAASGPDTVAFLTPVREVPPGSRIK